MSRHERLILRRMEVRSRHCFSKHTTANWSRARAETILMFLHWLPPLASLAKYSFFGLSIIKLASFSVLSLKQVRASTMSPGANLPPLSIASAHTVIVTVS